MTGYHNIESVFQKISLYDELYIEKGNEEEGIIIHSNVKFLEDDKNIICTAYNLLKSKFDSITSVNVILKKNIPMKAGLGGGSTDCATFIKCMNELFKLNLSLKQMQDIGTKIGADVPAAFCSRSLIARGIGEVIEEIESTVKYYLVIIKPNFSCDTKEMYKKLDNTSEIKQMYNSNLVKLAIENNDIKSLAKNLYNVFESSIDNIEIYKEKLKDMGALNSLMTGSGSCVYGVFKDKYQAKDAYSNLKRNYETYFCIVK